MLASQATPMQRSRGSAFASFRCLDGRARLVDLAQSGSAKAMLPRVSGVPEVVFLNTSGGLTDGDALSYGLDLAAGCRITATTQTAERVYASRGAPARAEVRCVVGAGGHLDWLPQETILFENSYLARDTQIDMAADASCLLSETVTLGRHAMGETLSDARLTDARMVRCAGVPVWAETFHLDPNVLADAQAALLGGARAFAVIALVAQGAEDALPRLRAALTVVGCEAAASGWDGKCIARIVARDGWPLKQQIALALAALRAGPLPRVWQM
ncbi:urease accessory protein UreD [Cypionkella aquatica]|uniref:Urease accessory protein UreD n=1 Tax=Cypionkella aquatica TaxID=1756042 RepID=A0AA37TR53_9RHOB|nr:urease accessory protein UreD [Cypionkella aquatica]GLS85768.1 urease accessory protein UreD [Cypionkella aquatica]